MLHLTVIVVLNRAMLAALFCLERFRVGDYMLLDRGKRISISVPHAKKRKNRVRVRSGNLLNVRVLGFAYECAELCVAPCRLPNGMDRLPALTSLRTDNGIPHAKKRKNRVRVRSGSYRRARSRLRLRMRWCIPHAKSEESRSGAVWGLPQLR